MGLKDYAPEEEYEAAGETVTVRGLSAGAAEDLVEDHTEDDSLLSFKRSLVALTVHDGDGLYFEDADDVKGVNLGVVNELYDIASRLSGLSDDAVDEAEGN